MANFYITLPVGEIARQVAKLLNDHNQLRVYHKSHTIMAGAGTYFIEVVDDQVVGCQAILQENDQLTRLYHLCVHPNWRRRGLARKLKLAALSHVTTPYAYVTIREDNIPSINLNMSVGFVFVKKDWAGGHNVLTLGRMMSNVQCPANTVVDSQRTNQSAAGQQLFLSSRA